MSLSTLGKIDMADKLSVAQLQQAVKAGSIPSYIGVPLIAEKMKEEQEARAAMAAQNTPQNSVAEQVMAQATQQEMSGLGDLPTNLPEEYAAGGIIGYDEGGDVDPEEYEEQLEDDMFNKYASAMMARGEMARGKQVNRTPDVEKGLREAPSMSYSQVQGQMPRAARQQGDMPTSSHKYADTVLKYAEQYGVDPKLALHVLNKETGGLKNPETAKSKAGAQGIMQTIPSTSKMLGIKDPYDPEQSAEGGVRYLAQLGKMFDNDPRLTAAAYNAGPGNVRKYNGVPPFAETQNYVKGLAEGGIASIPRYNGEDESVVEEPGFLDEIGTGLGKTTAAAADVISYLPRKAFKGINSMFGTNIPTTESDTPFYDKYYRTGEKEVKPTPVTPTATSTPAATDKAYPDESRFAKTIPEHFEGKQPEKPKTESEAPKTPEKTSPWQELRDMVADSKERRKQQKEQDMWLAIMSGGLGALAGQSQYANVNIGQGALHGMQQYGTARREAGKEEAADLKTMANIARYEGMDKYYNDQLENKLAATKGALDQKEYVAANNVMKSLYENRVEEAKAIFGKPDLWDEPTRKRAMDFINEIKLNKQYQAAELRLAQMPEGVKVSKISG